MTVHVLEKKLCHGNSMSPQVLLNCCSLDLFYYDLHQQKEFSQLSYNLINDTLMTSTKNLTFLQIFSNHIVPVAAADIQKTRMSVVLKD